jgi:hypothetical protein
MAPRGRKPKTLTDEQMSQVEALAAYLSQDQIADYLGTTRPTFAAMVARDADISLRYKRGKAKAIGIVAQGLLQKARDGDTTSAIFYLKTQAGWRETTVVDNKSSDGTMTPRPAIGADLTSLSDEELAQLERLTDKTRNSEGMGKAD